MKREIKREIFKFQRPLFTNADYNEVLIYNKDRSIEVVYLMSEKQMKDVFWNDEYKVYCLCSYKPPRSKIKIEQIVEEQDW